MQHDDVKSTICLFNAAVDDFDDSENKELYFRYSLANTLEKLSEVRPRKFEALQEFLQICQRALVMYHASAKKLATPQLSVKPTDAILKERTLAGLLARLKSFTNLSWSVKPVELSPLECAKFGWIAKEANLLTCVTCKNSLCIKQLYDLLPYKQFLRETVAKLRSSHEKLCPWKIFPALPAISADPILKFNNPNQDLEILTKIADSLSGLVAEIDDQLEFSIEICPETAEEFLAGVCAINIASVSSSADTDDQHHQQQQQQSSQKQLRRCFQLAVTGWSKPNPQSDELLKHFKPDKCPSILSCRFCLRRLGVWNLANLAQRQHRRHHPVDSNQLADADVSTGNLFDPAEPTNKRARLSSDLADQDQVAAEDLNLPKLELLSLHWLWCPWSSGSATRAWCSSVLQASPLQQCRKSASPLPQSMPMPTVSSSADTDASEPSAVAAEGCAKIMQLLRSIV